MRVEGQGQDEGSRDKARGESWYYRLSRGYQTGSGITKSRQGLTKRNGEQTPQCGHKETTSIIRMYEGSSKGR